MTTKVSIPLKEFGRIEYDPTQEALVCELKDFSSVLDSIASYAAETRMELKPLDSIDPLVELAREEGAGRSGRRGS